MLTGLLATTLAQTPDVAFVARYYKQGKARSFYRVYTCDHEGKGRKAVSPDGRDAHGFVWVDRTHLAYAMDADGVKSDPNLVSPRKIKVVLLDVASGKSKEIAQFNGDSSETYDSPGRRIVQSDLTALHVTAKGLTKQTVEEADFMSLGGDATLGTKQSEAEDTVAMKATVGDYELAWTSPFLLEEHKTVSVQVKGGGHTALYTLQGDTLAAAWPEGTSSLLVLARPSFTKFYAGHFLYRLDTKKDTAALLLRDVSQLDFDPARRLWIGAGPENRTLMKLANGKSVYTSEVFTGDWKAGKRWPIATGLVSVLNFGLARG